MTGVALGAWVALASAAGVAAAATLLSLRVSGRRVTRDVPAGEVNPSTHSPLRQSSEHRPKVNENVG
jgi:hypothetical protein